MAVCVGIIGLFIGSFAGATVWRLRALQLVDDREDKQPYDKVEYKRLLPLTKHTFRTQDRSQCLTCGHELGARDLVPLFSWLSTGGKCRYCRTPIGSFEPLIELGTALLFAASYLWWPYGTSTAVGITTLVIWLLACSILVVLFVYDLRWYLLHTLPMILLALLGIAMTLTLAFSSPHPMGVILSALGGLAILSGTYGLIYVVSRGTWVGLGDVELGVGLALLLADWRLAFVALFAANLIGSLIVAPGMMTGKIARTTRVPFGPLLIAGTVVALFFGHAILDWYMRFL